MRFQVNTETDKNIHRSGRCLTDEAKDLFKPYAFAAAYKGQTPESIGGCSCVDPAYVEWWEKEKSPEELIEENSSSKVNMPGSSVYVTVAGSRATATCAKCANFYRGAQQRSVDDNHNTRGRVNEGESNEMAKSFEKRSAYFRRRANDWWNSLVNKRSQQKNDSGMKAYHPDDTTSTPDSTSNGFNILDDSQSAGTPTADTTDRLGSSAWMEED